MLDPKFIRDNLELIKEGARKKHVKVDIDLFVKKDDERKETQNNLDEKRAEQNIITKKIAKEEKEGQRSKTIAEVSVLKAEIQKLEKKLKPILDEWNVILMEIPNPPSPKMPEGNSDEDNVTLRTWGEIPKFDFKPKTHDVLGKELDILDTEKAAEVSGSRFYYLKGDLVLLQFALTMFAFEVLTNEEIIKKVINKFSFLKKKEEIILEVLDDYSAISFTKIMALIVLSFLGWFFEVIELYLLFNVFNINADIFMAGFVFGFSSLIGLISFTPGGIIGFEASSGLLLSNLLGLTVSTAAVITLIIRLTTLWFAVLIGLITYLKYIKK